MIEVSSLLVRSGCIMHIVPGRLYVVMSFTIELTTLFVLGNSVSKCIAIDLALPSCSQDNTLMNALIILNFLLNTS